MAERIRVIIGEEERQFGDIKQALNYLVVATHDDLSACIREFCGDVEDPTKCPYTDDCDVCLSLVGDLDKCVKLIRSKLLRASTHNQ